MNKLLVGFGIVDVVKGGKTILFSLADTVITYDMLELSYKINTKGIFFVDSFRRRDLENIDWIEINSSVLLPQEEVHSLKRFSEMLTGDEETDVDSIIKDMQKDEIKEAMLKRYMNRMREDISNSLKSNNFKITERVCSKDNLMQEIKLKGYELECSNFTFNTCIMDVVQFNKITGRRGKSDKTNVKKSKEANNGK